MAVYYQQVRKLEDKFDRLELIHVGYDDNTDSDSMACLGFKCEPIPVKPMLIFITITE